VYIKYSRIQYEFVLSRESMCGVNRGSCKKNQSQKIKLIDFDSKSSRTNVFPIVSQGALAKSVRPFGTWPKTAPTGLCSFSFLFNFSYSTVLYSLFPKR